MDVSVSRGEGRLQQVVTIGPHRFLADASQEHGGDGAGPEPHDILAAALAACTTITLNMYAQRKQMALQDVKVRISHGQQEDAYVFTRHISYVGALSDDDRQRLGQIADRCPVHRTLSGTMRIETLVE